MDGESEEEIKEGICLIASVYTEYLMKKYVFERIVGPEDDHISLGLDMNSMPYMIRPLNIAYAVYFTKHFEAFVYGSPRYYLGKNGEWEELAEELIFQDFKRIPL